jgi:hypothetical protein
MPLLKKRARIAWPAGLGALAMTVKPPPANAPATTQYFIESFKVGTNVAR